MKFQTQPHETPSEIIIHVRMIEKQSLRQQEALGVIGVNLVHAAFYNFNEPDKVITSLMDDLSRERIEVDMIKFRVRDSRLWTTA